MIRERALAWAGRFGTVSLWRPAGTLILRKPTQPHRVVIPGGPQAPVWSLFVTGPRVREWGFWCPRGWRHWRQFTDARDAGKVGRGCE